MLIYLAIFISKIIENALATLRLIVVSNGKKKLGAILQGLVALVWVLVTGIVIVDINKDIFKIIAFCLGSITGSYLGSLLEEKIALGYNMTIAVINNDLATKVLKNLSAYKVTIINKDHNHTIIMISCKRKKTFFINNIINNIDKKALITNQRSKILFDKLD